MFACKEKLKGQMSRGRQKCQLHISVNKLEGQDDVIKSHFTVLSQNGFH